MRILAIKFNRLGDVVVAVPALRALRRRFPSARLEFAVAEDAAPLVRHLPWIDAVHALPRRLGRGGWRRLARAVAALRASPFDLSVDFVGNDRGALVTLLAAARRRAGLRVPGGFLGRRFAYTFTTPPLPDGVHETGRDLHLVRAAGVAADAPAGLELHPDPALRRWAEALAGPGAVLCQITASQPKKQWPPESWAAWLNARADGGAGCLLVAGPSPRERATLQRVAALAPRARTVDALPDVGHLLALVAAAGAVVTGDTLTSHLAAAVGVPVVALFGPTTASQWRPLGRARVLRPESCACWGHPAACLRASPCLAGVGAGAVDAALADLAAEGVRA